MESDDEGDTDEDDNAEVKKQVTIWVGARGYTVPTAAHNAAKAVLELVGKRSITDVQVEFREAEVHHSVTGPRLLAPVGDLDDLVNVISPLTPALGLSINAAAAPEAQGTMCLYLNDGSGRLLGLTCRHVVFSDKEPNDNYMYHKSGPRRNVHLLGDRAYQRLVDSIKRRIGAHGINVKHWERQIARFKVREAGDNTDDAGRAREGRAEAEKLVKKAHADTEKLAEFLGRVEKEWGNKNNRILGHVIASPPIALSVGEPRSNFTEDWALMELDREKLGPGYQGNAIDLGGF